MLSTVLLCELYSYMIWFDYKNMEILWLVCQQNVATNNKQSGVNAKYQIQTCNWNGTWHGKIGIGIIWLNRNAVYGWPMWLLLIDLSFHYFHRLFEFCIEVCPIKIMQLRSINRSIWMKMIFLPWTMKQREEKWSQQISRG